MESRPLPGVVLFLTLLIGQDAEVQPSPSIVVYGVIDATRGGKQRVFAQAPALLELGGHDTVRTEGIASSPSATTASPNVVASAPAASVQQANNDAFTATASPAARGKDGPEEEDEEEEEEEEKELILEHTEPSMGRGVALTLLVGISFIMCIQYLINSRDDDIRRYSWQMIISTISIFCAVLLFVGINSVIEKFMMGTSKAAHLYVAQLHMFSWCVVLRGTLVFFPGRKGYVVLLAHITGFAGIKAWGGVQQYDFFKQNFLTAVLVLPISLAGIIVMTRVADLIVFLGVDRYVSRAHIKPEAKKHIAESSEEALHDVIGFPLAFMTVQAFRLLITGSLPNPEGEEKEEELLSRTFLQAFILAAIGFGFLMLTALTFMKEDALAEVEKQEHEERVEKRRSRESERKAAEEARAEAEARAKIRARMRASIKRQSVHTDISILTGQMVHERDDGESSDDEVHSMTVGIMEGFVMYFAMTFAFCLFFSGLWACAAAHFSKDETIMHLILATVMSLITFGAVFVLDKIDDMHKEEVGGDGDDSEHRTIVQIIVSLALLIGFSWERLFDRAVVVFAAKTSQPEFVKLGLAIAAALLLIPAWKSYMLPMILHDGWRYGFVVHGHWDKQRILDAIAFLNKAVTVKRASLIKHGAEVVSDESD